MENSENISFVDKWDESYSRAENYLLYPNEEVVRFASSNLCKIKPDGNDFKNSFHSGSKILDYGCGAGRHIAFLSRLGFSPYGVDISQAALDLAHQNLAFHLNTGPNSNVKISKIDDHKLPFEDGFFDGFIACSVLDSMHFKLAQKIIAELFRVTSAGALGHIDLISNCDSNIDSHFSGDKLVNDQHENGTIQSYFNRQKINKLLGDMFSIKEICHVKHEYLESEALHSRFYVQVTRN